MKYFQMSVQYKYDDIIYSLNEKQKTSSVIGCKSVKDEVIIPSKMQYESNEYIVTSISKYAFKKSDIKSIKFTPDSKIQTIEEKAFILSSIESIMIPSNLINLKEGWCTLAHFLTKIELSSNNPRYSILDDKMIIGKSSIEKENYDVLVFCVRDVQEVKIPAFIETIGPYAFDRCNQLQKIEFQNDSKIQSFDLLAFSWTFFDEITIPSQVKRIGEQAFSCCHRLKKINIPSNSLISIIEKDAFRFSSIECFTIPASLIELKDEWCIDTNKLTKIDVDPNNPRYSILDDKMVIGKSLIDQDNYDVLVFVVRNIKAIKIPSFIKCIGPSSLDSCYQLQRIEFDMDSELKIIEEHAFNASSIICIVIPPKVSEIKQSAFSFCKKLQIIEMNEILKLEFIDQMDVFEENLNVVIMIPNK